MQPLSLEKEKPMLRILGKNVLEHTLDQLNGLVQEAFLIIRPNHKGQAIVKKVGEKYEDLRIKYIIQKQSLGTGDAARLAFPFLKEKFLLLNGDDLYFKRDIKKILKKFPAILVKEVKNPSSFGIVCEKKGKVISLVEKPEKPKSTLANTGLYFLPKKIFNFSIKKSPRGEYEFTDYIKQFIREQTLYSIVAERWLPVSFCWDVLEANKMFLSEIENLREGKVEKNCNIKGKATISRGSLIKSGTYIEGPVYIGKNCMIGPNCFLRKFTVIGDNCHIGQAVEIKNSVIGDNVNIAHLSYVGDSIIENNCNLGAGTITANLRHDGKTIKTKVNGRLIDTGRRKLGTIMGEGAKTGIGTLIYPGRKIWPRKTTLPGERVVRDIK